MYSRILTLHTFTVWTAGPRPEEQGRRGARRGLPRSSSCRAHSRSRRWSVANSRRSPVAHAIAVGPSFTGRPSRACVTVPTAVESYVQLCVPSHAPFTKFLGTALGCAPSVLIEFVLTLVHGHGSLGFANVVGMRSPLPHGWRACSRAPIRSLELSRREERSQSLSKLVPMMLVIFAAP
ncbi:hypothetical protein BC628DRAFT_1048420 [Trametes gibbosa]|nr:hypothetical protein BC628DRAFT_1048420 [Trametes gibbosa]